MCTPRQAALVQPDAHSVPSFRGLHLLLHDLTWKVLSRGLSQSACFISLLTSTIVAVAASAHRASAVHRLYLVIRTPIIKRLPSVRPSSTRRHTRKPTTLLLSRARHRRRLRDFSPCKTYAVLLVSTRAVGAAAATNSYPSPRPTSSFIEPLPSSREAPPSPSAPSASVCFSAWPTAAPVRQQPPACGKLLSFELPLGTAYFLRCRVNCNACKW